MPSQNDAMDRAPHMAPTSVYDGASARARDAVQPRYRPDTGASVAEANSFPYDFSVMRAATAAIVPAAERVLNVAPLPPTIECLPSLPVEEAAEALPKHLTALLGP